MLSSNYNYYHNNKEEIDKDLDNYYKQVLLDESFIFYSYYIMTDITDNIYNIKYIIAP